MVKDCGTGIAVGLVYDGPALYVSKPDIRRGSKPPIKGVLDGAEVDDCGLPEIESSLNPPSTYCSSKGSGSL